MTTDEEYIKFLEDIVIEERRYNRWLLTIAVASLFALMLIAYTWFRFAPVDNWTPKELSHGVDSDFRAEYWCIGNASERDCIDAIQDTGIHNQSWRSENCGQGKTDRRCHLDPPRLEAWTGKTGLLR